MNNKQISNKCRAAYREELAPGIYKMTFYTDECRFSAPGQYALIRTADTCRPYQVCDYDSNRFTVVFRLSDKGSRELAELESGTEIEAVTGLGHGFDVDSIPDNSVLAADSMGISEMLELARSLLTRGKRFKAVLGYRSRTDMYMVDSFRNICNELEVLTLDGSNGREGLPSDVIRNADYVCASGSAEMLRALAGKSESGQFSLSEMMFGSSGENGGIDVASHDIPMNCLVDGPVFDKNTVAWDRLNTERWSRAAY